MENIIREEMIDSICSDTSYPFWGYGKWMKKVGRQLNIEQLIRRFSKVVRDIDLSGFCWKQSRLDSSQEINQLSG